jgi:hypothetical protein
MVERRPGLLRLRRLIWTAKSELHTREDIERATNRLERERTLTLVKKEDGEEREKK